MLLPSYLNAVGDIDKGSLMLDALLYNRPSMTGTHLYPDISIVLGGVCRSTTAALRIHRLGADNAKNPRE